MDAISREEAISDEIWKVIDGWEQYEVSSFGRVRRINTGRFMKPDPSRKGYFRVGLSQKGKHKSVLVAGIVARAFIGQPLIPDMTVNHIDGVKTNNTPSNLEYLTRAENNQHAVRMGLHVKGEKQGAAKLTDDSVRELRRRYIRGVVGYQRLARDFGVNKSTCREAINGETWAHVK